MPAGGKIGNKGGGRTSNTKADKLKGILLDAILKEVEILETDTEDVKAHKQARSIFWAEKVASKLVPQVVEGSGSNGEIMVAVSGFQYVKPEE